MPINSSPLTLYNIQILRGIAALFVVAHHVFILVNERGMTLASEWDWVGGAAGVDIFFPISGFLMVWTTQQGWGRRGGNRLFLLKRVLRIAPLYWILTSAKVAALLVVPALALRGGLEPWHTAASYLFLPAVNASAGHDHPVLPLGWTLNLEMFFYVLFALTLAVGKNPLRWLTPILVLIGGLGALGLAPWPPLRFYFDPIVLEFVFGMLVGALVIRRMLLPVAPACFIVVLSSIVMIAAEYIPGFSPGWRTYIWGIPGALILWSLISLEGRFTRLPGYSTALAVGDASYAIYLSHGFVLTVVGLVCARMGYTGLGPSIAVVAVCLAISIGLGLWLHRFVERPLGRYLKRYLPASRKIAALPPPAPSGS